MTTSLNPQAIGRRGSSLADGAPAKLAPAPNGSAPRLRGARTITLRPAPPSGRWRWSLKHTPTRGKS